MLGKWMFGLVVAAAFPTLAFAECWRLPDGQVVIGGNARSTPPVKGAKSVRCPQLPLGPSNQVQSQQQQALKAPTNAVGRYPVNGPVTQRYGQKWSENPLKIHTGVDIAAAKGTTVAATTDGMVSLITDMGSAWGKGVVVSEVGGTAKAYLHVAPQVRVGDKVRRGDRVGTVWLDHVHYNVCSRLSMCERGALPDTQPDPKYPNDPLFRNGPFVQP